MASVRSKRPPRQLVLRTFAKRTTVVVTVTDVTMHGYRPARGARIETVEVGDCQTTFAYRPARGARIETS